MPTFTNRYYAFRHGESTANVARMIISDPAAGTMDYGLSEKGKSQVERVANFTNELGFDVKIYSSDFLRARETALIAHRLLATQSPVQFTPQLRERYFGELNGCSDDNYRKVWAVDATNPDHHQFGVESANEVVARGAKLIAAIDTEHSGKTILLVAHGDVLQIMQTWFEGVSAACHRQLTPLNTAEVRCFTARSENS